MGLHRMRGFLGIIAALAITAGALIAALAPDESVPDPAVNDGY